MNNPCKGCDVSEICHRLPKDLTCEEIGRYAEIEKAGAIIHADISQVSSWAACVPVALRQTPDGKAEMRIVNAIAEMGAT